MSEQRGEITIRSTGIGKNKIKAISSAEQNAIELLLFRGIPNSQQTTPLVSINEQQAKTQYKAYFEELLTRGRHKTFILSSVPVTDLVKQGQGMRNISVDVRINLTALRADLEQHNVTRKFGF